MIWLALFIEHFLTVKTYENIALRRHAWQRYPFHGTPWNATYAVDGRRSDLAPAGGQCAISADDKSIAEWRVDLGKVRNLHHVFIQYRTDNVAWDENDYFKSRVLGFSIYVSNTTYRNDWRLCFKDNKYTRATIPNPISVTCVMHGRYVIYYNNRTHHPFPAGYSTYAFNDLCEVEVYGCLTLGYYGENCSTPCPENCKGGDCDIVDGTCVSCVPGYSGSMCNIVCGACYEKEQCDFKNGTCPNGCEDGYKGRQCKTVCTNNTYGPNCSMTCGHCLYLYGEKCNHVTGQCPRGCASGFQGDLCVESRSEFRNTTLAWSTYNATDKFKNKTLVRPMNDGCLTLGYYGENCSTPCPENCKGGDCDIVDGTCISCVPGYSGSMCNIVCGACYEKEQCDYKNGTCPNGCEDGYKGRQCKSVCNKNTYGPNCSRTCGHCLYLYGEKCNHVTGQCPRGCASGFQGDLCVESRSEFRNTTLAWSTYNATDTFKNKTLVRPMNNGCLTLGYYGENCSTPCPENCKGGDCDNVDGTCVSCIPGYSGSMCNIVCGACYEKEQCDYKNGTCPNGCKDGYKGRQCKTVCNNNTYGPNCSRTCGHCLYLYGEKCNHVTGQCPRGCASGFQGDLCVESRSEFRNTTLAWSTYNATDKFKNKTLVRPMNNGCLTLGYYGEKCSTPCPKNCKGGDCHIVAGTCISCVHGYTGSICNKVCGACYEKEQCDFKNGTCPSGCEDGYKGRQCKTVCNNNTYGPNCSMTCGHCLYLYGEKCNHVTGQCPRGCASGFQGDLCVESRDEFKNKTTVAWPTYNDPERHF
nr:protein draper isoform X3 [Crassostrea gigas]